MASDPQDPKSETSTPTEASDGGLKDKLQLGAAVGVIALIGVIGLVFVVGMFLVTIVIIAKHDWPWFHPADELIVRGPGAPGVAIGCAVAFFVALGIRLSRRKHLGLPVLGPLVAATFSTLGWTIHAHTVLGSASYFIFRWIADHGTVAMGVYALMSFFAGVAPGFLAPSGLLLYLVYNDPQILWVTMVPAIAGELLDSSFGQIYTDEESTTAKARQKLRDAGMGP